jgi:hypothetical protein
VLVAAIVGFYFKRIPIQYTAYSKIFPLVQNGENDPLSNIKSSLGIDGGSEDIEKYYNVSELVNSKSLSRKIVSYPVSYNNQEPLSNVIIKDEILNRKYKLGQKKISLSKDSVENNILAAEIFTSHTTIKKEKSEFTSLFTSSCNPTLSLRLNEVILECLSEFYTNSRTEKSRTDLHRLERLKDSIYYAIDRIELDLARYEGTSRFAAQEVVKLPQIKLERLREELVEHYKTTTTAYQSAKYKLMSESPIFQILDRPSSPVAKSINPWKKMTALGFIIGALLTSLIVCSRIIKEQIIQNLG